MHTRTAGRPPDAPPPANLADTARRLKAIFVGSSGNLVEWFDFYAYSAFALYFAAAFFPSESQTAQLLNAAAIFAVGFLMRPIGGWLFGRFADRHGRRLALTVSVLLMCAGSLLIAVTPTYDSIGVAAPLILLFARLVQGLSLGGEYGTSATYLTEMAHPEHRGFYSSFQYVTLIGGQLLAMIVLLVLQKLLLTPEQLAAWGWRIPFAIGAGLAIVVYFMRRDMHETEAFVEASGIAGRAEPLQGPHAPSARGGDRRRADARRHRRLLHLHDLHAEVPGEHGGPVEGHRHRRRRQHAVSLHVPAAGRGRHLRRHRPAAGAAHLRRARHAADRADPERAAGDQGSLDRLRADHGRAADRQRLHGDQRRGESGAVPDAACARWAWAFPTR